MSPISVACLCAIASAAICTAAAEWHDYHRGGRAATVLCCLGFVGTIVSLAMLIIIDQAGAP